jgi:hypothetical protein
VWLVTNPLRVGIIFYVSEARTILYKIKERQKKYRILQRHCSPRAASATAPVAAAPVAPLASGCSSPTAAAALMAASEAAVAAAAVSIGAAPAVAAAASSPYLLPGASRLFVAAPIPSGSVGASHSLRYAALDPLRPLLG